MFLGYILISVVSSCNCDSLPSPPPASDKETLLLLSTCLYWCTCHQSCHGSSSAWRVLISMSSRQWCLMPIFFTLYSHPGKISGPIHKTVNCERWRHLFWYGSAPSSPSGRRKSCSCTIGWVTLTCNMDICSMKTWRLFLHCLVYPLPLYVSWSIWPYTFHLCGMWRSILGDDGQHLLHCGISDIWVTKSAASHITSF
jgi:hypothetical protein